MYLKYEEIRTIRKFPAIHSIQPMQINDGIAPCLVLVNYKEAHREHICYISNHAQ